MASTKALLKAVNEAIKQQKWDTAIETVGEVIEKDAKNYQAQVYLVSFRRDSRN